MSPKSLIDENELHAYLDGALPADRAGDVERQIAADPALAGKLAGFRADKQMLKTVYGPLADKPLPAHWLAMARQPKPKPVLTWRLVGSIAAVLVLGLGLGLAYRAMVPVSGEIVQTALGARQSGDGQTIAVAGRDDARTAQAISRAVALKLKVPDLSRMGYRLSAVRLYPGAAQLSYLGPQQRLFTLYLHRSDGTARFDQFERAGLRVCIWQDDQLSLVMAGDVSTASMQRLASLAYTGLTL